MVEAYNIGSLCPPLIGQPNLLEILQPIQGLSQNSLPINKYPSHFSQHDQTDEMLLDGKGMVLQVCSKVRLISQVPQIHQDIPQLLLMPVRYQVTEVLLPDKIKFITLQLEILS